MKEQVWLSAKYIFRIDFLLNICSKGDFLSPFSYNETPGSQGGILATSMDSRTSLNGVPVLVPTLPGELPHCSQLQPMGEKEQLPNRKREIML